MREFVGQALVLRREDLGEHDERITLFTPGWGKVRAKTISTRKPLSKLSPHLDVGNVVQGRFVEKHDLQLVDALKVRSTEWSLFDLYALDRLLFEDDVDEVLWGLLLTNSNSWEDLLSYMGWDTQYARCATCDSAPVVAFDLGRQNYACGKCSGYLKRDDRLLLEMHNTASQ